MDDRFNTAAGWVLFSGIVALGASIVSGMYFGADKHHEVEKPGFFIEGAAEEGGEGSGPDLGTLLAASDVAAGEKIFAKCAACHTINSGGANGIGPNLFGVLGTGIGKHAAGFAYSAALSGHGGNWDYANMDAWLKSPRGFADGTKMSFAGLSKAEDRANLMAYLKSMGGGPDFPAPAAPATAEAAPADGAVAEADATAEGDAEAVAAAAQDAGAETAEATE